MIYIVYIDTARFALRSCHLNGTCCMVRGRSRNMPVTWQNTTWHRLYNKAGVKGWVGRAKWHRLYVGHRLYAWHRPYYTAEQSMLVDTRSTASAQHLNGRYAYCGRVHRWPNTWVNACLANRPIIVFPMGSWRARTRRFWGLSVVFWGLGRKVIHPSFHICGIWGGFTDHHASNLWYTCLESWSAMDLITRPGRNGLATALVTGMAFSAALSSGSLNGIPGGPGYTTVCVCCQYSKLHEHMSSKWPALHVDVPGHLACCVSGFYVWGP